MKIICFILARSNSKSIKNKNLLKIKNKTLLNLTIDFAKKLNFLDKIVFNTDSVEYSKLAKQYGLNEVFIREKKLARDTTTSIEVLKNYINKSKNFDFSHILLLQPTTPFRSLDIFNEAYKIIKKNYYDSVITINKIKDEPERMLTVNSKKIITNYFKNKKYSFDSRQKLKQKYIRSGSMYFFKTSNLSIFNSILGKKNYGIEVHGKYAINIDDLDDYYLAKSYK